MIRRATKMVITSTLMVSEQRAQDLETQAQRFGRDVHRHPLEDEDGQRGARMRLQLFLKRFFLEIDRDPAQWIGCLRRWQTFVLVGDELGFVELDPRPALEAKGTAVETAAD